MKISPARAAAFEILSKVETDQAFTSILLPQFEQKLSPKDRALCHEITLGVLRRQIYLDRIIENFTRVKKLDAAVLIALRIGLYQLLFLDKIPNYSIVNESVNLVQKAKKSSAKGLVNAVLRRASKEEFVLTYEDEVDRISVETSHPRWLIEKWIVQFGIAETEKLAKANNEISQITFRATLKTLPETLNFLNNFKKSELAENCFLAAKFDETLLNLAERGEIYFQDEASQTVANAIQLEESSSFLDVCAAPGSKTTLIAKNSRNYQANQLLAAGDIHNNRINFLAENCSNQGADFVNIIQYDAENSLPFAEKSFEQILLDAPCSGTGTIRHNPEIRYFLQPEDFASLADKQLKLLKNASQLVKSGGTLIYSTCSLETEENEEVIEKFLSADDFFEKVQPSVTEKILTREDFGRTFPQAHNTDGFFIAVLKRK